MDDESSKLSLTNLALIAVTIKAVWFPAGWSDVALLIAVLLNYVHKRHTFIRKREAEQILEKRFVTIEAALAAAQTSLAELEKFQDPTHKTIEELKSFINAQKLSNSFTRRQL